jgi:DNA-binding NarL/FixJ family response regulator
MKRIDEVFGKLTSAWTPLVRRVDAEQATSAEVWRGLIPPPDDARSAWPSTLPSAHSVPPPRRGPDATDGDKEQLVPLVLLATPPVESSASIPDSVLKAHAIVAGLNARRQVRGLAVTPFRPGDLEHLLVEFQPRVLLIDVALVERLGLQELRRVHRRLPATDWMLLWNEPSVEAFELAVRALMRGCEKWDAPLPHLERAVTAVIAGEVWFPRQALQSLYLSLLAATQTHSTSGPMPLDEAEPERRAAGGNLALTSREIEALALMRQGLSNKQIAERLNISINTVKKHLAHAFDKRGLHNRRQSMA